MITEIEFGLAGFFVGAIGSKLISKYLTAESISTPLLDKTVIPKVTIDDYTYVKKYKGPIIKSDYFNAYILFDGIEYHRLLVTWNYITNEQQIFYKNLSTGIDINKSEIATKTITSDSFKLTSQSSIMIQNINPLTSKITLNMPELSYNIDSIYFPFKLNNGKTSIIIPNDKYVDGIENTGPCTGILNGNKVSGLSIFERLNWNFEEFDFIGYRWIPFSVPGLSGIFIKGGLYYDAGVWYNGIYYKPEYFEINILNYDSQNNKADERIIACFGKDVFRMEMKLISYDTFYAKKYRQFYTVMVYINDVFIGTGYSWQESSLS